MAKEKQDKNTEEPPKKGKKKLIFIGVGVLLIAGGIFGVMAMTGGGGDEEPVEETPPATSADKVKTDSHGDPIEAGEGAAADDGHEGTSDTSAAGDESGEDKTDFLFQRDFSVNIFDGNSMWVLNTQLHVDTSSPSVVAELKANVAPARDAIIMLLASKTLDEIRTTEAKVRLKQEIVRRLNAEFGAGSIRDVHFTKFLILQD